MAKPQLENGYTSIANELLEHLAKLHLPLDEFEEQAERVVSRGRDAAEAVILFNSAPDFRPSKKAREGRND